MHLSYELDAVLNLSFQGKYYDISKRWLRSKDTLSTWYITMTQIYWRRCWEPCHTCKAYTAIWKLFHLFGSKILPTGPGFLTNCITEGESIDVELCNPIFITSRVRQTAIIFIFMPVSFGDWIFRPLFAGPMNMRSATPAHVA